MGGAPLLFLIKNAISRMEYYISKKENPYG